MKSLLVVREYDDFSRILRENGFEIINCPTIETVPLDDLSEFEYVLDRLVDYDGIFLTSAVAAEVFRQKLIEKSVNYSGQIYVLGEKSFSVLQNEKLDLVFDKTHNRAIEMLEAVPREMIVNKRFLFVRGDKSLRVIPDYLRKYAAVDEAIVYQTKSIKIAAEQRRQIVGKISRNEINCACFFSPSGAKNFIEQFSAEFLHQINIAAIGKTTAKFLEAQNIKVDFVSSMATAKDYARELIVYLKN